MACRKAKPKSPEQILAERIASRATDLQAVNLPGELATLAAGADIEVRRESQRNTLVARRLDVFDALRDGMAPGAFDATRRLERDIRMRRGEHDHGRPVQRVQGDDYAAHCRNDQIIAAGERVDAVMKRLAPRDFWLLTELIIPVASRPTWRQAVAYITGEVNPHAQAATVRAACVNLRDAYEVRVRKVA